MSALWLVNAVCEGASGDKDRNKCLIILLECRDTCFYRNMIIEIFGQNSVFVSFNFTLNTMNGTKQISSLKKYMYVYTHKHIEQFFLMFCIMCY